jgi:hypothetical protein
MVLSVIISAVQTVLTIAMAYLGVHVTLHPPSDETPKIRFRYKSGFFVCATLSVALVIWQAVLNQHSQQDFTRTVGDLRTQVSSLQVTENAEETRRKQAESDLSNEMKATGQATRVGVVSDIKQSPILIKLQSSQSEARRITSLTVEVRATCTLRDPTQIPGSIRGPMDDKTSYLEGPRGRFYLLTDQPVPIRRGETEGQVTVDQTFSLAPTSNLIGKPLSWTSEFEKLFVQVWSIEDSMFSECNYMETTVLVNGDQIYQRTAHKHVVVGKGQVLTSLQSIKGEIK